MANSTVTIGNGCAVSDRFLVITAFPDALPPDSKFTRLFYFNLDFPENWQHRDWPDETAVSICFRNERSGVRRAACVLSEDGAVEIANSSEVLPEQIYTTGLDGTPETAMSMRCIAEIEDNLFACGYNGQVYQRDQGIWIPIGWAKSPLHFDHIAGLTKDEIFLCGLNGILYAGGNKQWRKMETGTDAHLLDIHCVSKTEIIVSGYWQTLLAGNVEDGFRIIHEADNDLKLWSVRKFQDKIYVGTSQGLRRLNGTTLEVIRQQDIGFDEHTIVQKIDSASDNFLWIVGDRHVFRYDGKRIEKFEHPDNI